MNIVIPYKIPPKHQGTDELRYALRSIEKHVVNKEEILVVGEKPEWLTNVSFLPLQQCSDIKARNIINAFNIGAFMFDEFVVWHDDMFAITDLYDDELRKIYYLEDLSKIKNFGPRKFQQDLRKGKEILESLGLSAYNYVSHIPHWVNSKAWMEIYRMADIQNNPLGGEENFLYNYMGVGEANGSCKNVRAARYDERPFNPEEAKGKKFINFDEKGKGSGIFEYVKSLFPEKSHFEKD